MGKLYIYNTLQTNSVFFGLYYQSFLLYNKRGSSKRKLLHEFKIRLFQKETKGEAEVYEEGTREESNEKGAVVNNGEEALENGSFIPFI